MEKIMKIDGMSCGHCTASVDKALRTLPGVSEVKVDLASKSASLKTDDTVSDALLKKTIEDLGFNVVS
ncbi:MAG: heavy-metal-associated domain-containing protein [Deltaproteobacteria bacterium]|jgi:copper chaperone CopZ|nr:heavy-metal-associated domain-containing protein [Deltaproteobacteria bacterium]